jgi:hypothetical protein
MTRVRVCVIVGLAGIATIMPANASTQDCPGWLKWACSASASSNPVRAVAPRERQRAGTPAASSSSKSPITKQVRTAPDGATRQQLKRRAATRPVKVARNNHSSDSSGDRRPIVMNDQERKALFQQFLAWQKTRRMGADANSDSSGDQRPIVMNDHEKEALFQEFLARQRKRHLDADANR